MVEELLAKAGVTIGGSAPQDIQVYDKAMYGRVLRHGSLGLGEAYMDGQWDANDLAVFIEYVLRARLDRTVNRTLDTWVLVLQAAFSNLQGRFRARQVAKQHYDLTDILPSPLLDPYNQYTCAYFDQTTDLDTAQERKLDLICRKLRFRKEDRVLDIGCGWGGLAKYIAEHYGCHVTGRISKIHRGALRLPRNRHQHFGGANSVCQKLLRGVTGRHSISGLPGSHRAI